MASISNPIICFPGLSSAKLNARQITDVDFLKENGRITNKDYHTINKCSRNTASTQLVDLVTKGFLKASSVKGAGSFYTFN